MESTRLWYPAFGMNVVTGRSKRALGGVERHYGARGSQAKFGFPQTFIIAVDDPNNAPRA